MGLALLFFASINMILAVFNLIPIHPLDGGQIFGAMISENNPEFASKLQAYGPLVLLGIIILERVANIPILTTIMSPFNYLVFMIE